MNGRYLSVSVGRSGAWLVAFVAAIVIGLQVGDLPLLTFLPPGALVTLMLVAVATPIILRNWRLGLAGLLIWFVAEDLVRKFAGNDLRVYFVKDVAYAVLLAALVADPRMRKAWRQATGEARVVLYALVAWALVLSIPTGIEDWRLPLAGLRLDFLYLPLVVAGYLIAREPLLLRRWLIGLAVLGGVASSLGILQAIIGPEFLAPERPTPHLGLVLIRGISESGPVFRPSGSFVSSGRFASMALVALALGLAALLASSRRYRAAGVTATLSAAGAVWVSGGRGPFLAGASLVALAAVTPMLVKGRPALRPALVAAGAGLAAVTLLAAFFPALYSSRLIWYRETLDPRSPGNEWAGRRSSVAASTIQGIRVGGLIGQGTGRESLGRQYFYEGETDSPFLESQVEGGYASVAVEWGVAGLALWIAWSVAWTRRLWRSISATRGSPFAASGLVILGWIIYILFIGFLGGLQGFQDFISNAYFWLLSGIVFGLPAAAHGDRVANSSHAPA